MLRNNRILRLSGSTFTDFSVGLSQVHGTSKVLNLQLGDYLYVGSDLPFNHRYFDLKVVNDVAAIPTIEIWDGVEWQAVVDILDETAVNGVPFAQSGIISFQPNLRVSGWGRQDTEDMANSDLEDGPKIYQLYWARISYSVALKTTMELYHIGHRFSIDLALFAEYPDLQNANLMAAYKSGKTDWKEQSMVAAEYIIQDLRGIKNLIQSPSQILDWRQFEKASIHRTANIAFGGMGDDYTDQKLEAWKDYKAALAVGKFNVDENSNATLDALEKQTNVSYGSR